MATTPSAGPTGPPSLPAHVAAIQRPVEKLMTYYVVKAVLSTVAFPVVLPMLYFRYHSMRYKFDAEGIQMRWGILFRQEILLNYLRIQDIHLESSLIERFLGLARIKIQTAASGSKAEMTLEGLTDHEAMRDFLYSRMRGARARHHPEDITPQADERELVRTLSDVAAELRAIRLLLQEQRPHA